MNGRQNGRVLVVAAGPCTVAGTQLSGAIVRALHGEGGVVVVGDNDPSRWASIVAELGDRCVFMPLDVGSEFDWAELVDAVVAAYGRIDGLVYSARLRAAHTATAVEMSAEDYDVVIETNQVGVFLGTRAVLPTMLAAGRGAIVTMSSIDGLRGVAGWSAYCGAAHAVVGFTRSVALEIAASGVRINAVCGSPTSAIAREVSAETIDFFVKQVPMGRLATPEEVAEVVAFLASDDSAACTGGVFVADMGRMAGPAAAASVGTR